MNREQLTSRLKSEAQRLGFRLSGVCRADRPPHAERFGQWLAQGYAGEMHYLPQRADAYQHPQHVLQRVRSILMLAMDYGHSEPAPCQIGQGRVSRYAWGTVDYHDVIHQRLRRLAALLRQLVPTAAVRGVVDTAPLLERPFAQLAGLGWIGKNTLLLNPQAGSWFFLAALLTDVELAYDPPFAADHCGTCRACLDACPTDAFPQPYVLDARRCISYLTIELRQAIPSHLRGKMADWLFGCDVCQDVCPWNQRVPQGKEEAFRPRADLNPVNLLELFELDDAAFRRRFRNTPLWRSKRPGLLRNAAILLGNQRHRGAVAALCRGLCDVEPLVRQASAWALGQCGGQQAITALDQRLPQETDQLVRAEIQMAQQSAKR